MQIKYAYADVQGTSVSLRADNFSHIEFKRIKSSHYVFNNNQLKVAVEGSASFLMKPFDDVELINRVSFKWRSKGVPEIKNALHEESRAGDDAVFKLGLLLSGEDSFPNLLLPSWMKRVEKNLHHPSNSMIYLVANAKHISGQRWVNPYNKRITMIAANNAVDDKGWKTSSYRFDAPVDVVALWLMSDGDNTDSAFTVHIKDIIIE